MKIINIKMRTKYKIILNLTSFIQVAIFSSYGLFIGFLTIESNLYYNIQLPFLQKNFKHIFILILCIISFFIIFFLVKKKFRKLIQVEDVFLSKIYYKILSILASVIHFILWVLVVLYFYIHDIEYYSIIVFLFFLFLFVSTILMIDENDDID